MTSISNKTTAIIGGGAAGCICAKFLADCGAEFFLFDKGKFLRTLLPTGGGRCNLANALFDFRDLAKNYPRGEKFLYSLFSKFSTADTLELFSKLGVETYIQEDNRIFPQSNSSKDVRTKILQSLQASPTCKMISEEVLKITPLDGQYKLTTPKASYLFDNIVFATGGHSDYDLIKNLGIKIIEPVQSLVGMVTKEDFSSLAGVSLKNVHFKQKNTTTAGDIIFTHKGISGPLIYKISSIFARKEMPYTLNLRLIDDIDLQTQLDKNSKKNIKNLLGNFIPKSLAAYVLSELNIAHTALCHQINGRNRDKILDRLYNFSFVVTSKVPDGEVVTCGGVDLSEINPKTLEAKKYKGIYFCGEVLDIDGFCGGFNLQNCWSSAFVCAESIINSNY